MKFKISATEGFARRGELEFDRGSIQTPAFMPVGTNGTVKALEVDNILETGAEIILGNTYHLMLRPGDELIKKLGGLHKFSNWSKPILTDSGGFQVWSLGDLAKITEEGISFQSPYDGSKHFMSPEDSMRIQQNLGSDIVMVLDECTPYPSTHQEARKSMELSMRWAQRSMNAHQSDSALFGIVQGGMHEDLRLETLSGFIATLIGADVQQSKLAAKLSKSDLVTGMVDECPELQGLMGKYFALSEGQDAAVAEAIADQYSPKGPSDNCPSSPVSMALALAEKIDILVGFFGINEKPTGSKDPFALRRASLGIIRLVIENNIRIDLSVVINYSVSTYMNFNKKKLNVDDLLNFFWDRLKIYAKDKNISHDIIGAEFSWDFVKLLAKANSLQSFIYTNDGKNLLAGYKRATNILHAEEKKAGKLFDGKVSQPDLSMDEEIELYKALQGVDVRVAAAIKAENFAVAMKELSSLRSPIDEFLNKVTVNSDVGRERENRLKLLSHIRSTMNAVAQFSKIEG